MAVDKRKTRRAGLYWSDENVPYVSVTHVLGEVIRKRALEYWYGQQVYFATIADPEIDERTALASPYKQGKEAADRGTTVHSIIESYKNTGKQIETVPPQFRGYANAFYDWVDAVKPEILENERSVYNHQHRYAGTLDMLARIGGKLYVVDFKTNKKGDIYNEAHLQVSAYIETMRSEAVEGGLIVSLSESGTYTHQTVKNGFKAFLAALELYKFLNADKLIKLGWSKEDIYG